MKHKIHLLLTGCSDIIGWAATELDMVFMHDYTVTPDPIPTVEEILELVHAGLPMKPYTICFSTDDDALAIIVKLRWSDVIVDASEVM